MGSAVIKKINKRMKKHKKDIVFNNLSINGNTTRMALERMPYDIQSNSPEYLLVQFGMNDANYWLSDKGVPRVSIDSFESNLKEILSRANAIGVKKIFINTNHISTLTNIMKNTNISYQESVREYNKIIRKVAKASSVVLIDIEKAFSTLSGDELKKYILKDGVHLSKHGHKLYLKTVFPFIYKELNEEIK